MTPVHVTAQVHQVRRTGAYHEITFVAPDVAKSAKPGQFVTVTVGGEHSSLLLPRAFAIAGVAEWGIPGGLVRIVVAPVGVGTHWLVKVKPGDSLQVTGPLGRGFRLPKGAVNAVLVGGGYGSAPLLGLADRLRERAARVEMVLGAATADRLYAVASAHEVSHRLYVTTEDGTAGELGRVTDSLAGLMKSGHVDVIYACGPMPMLEAVADIADREGLPCQISVEEPMACGIGVCMSCVLPIRGTDGVTRMARCCVEGPVFTSDAVRFADLGTVPDDALGANAMADH